MSEADILADFQPELFRPLPAFSVADQLSPDTIALLAAHYGIKPDDRERA